MVIQGLTFSGGYADAGAGLLRGGTSPVLRDLVVQENVVPLPAPDPGGDLGASTSTRAEGVVGHGGGILIAQGTPRIADSELRDNRASIGGGFSIVAGIVTLDRTRVTRNNASVGGGGIHVGHSARLLSTEGAVIDFNAVPWPSRLSGGEGLDLLAAPLPGADVRPNTGVARRAGGIWIEGDAVMSDALVHANQALIHDEAGIGVGDAASLSLHRSEVRANGGDGISVEFGGALLLDGVAVSDNTGHGLQGSGALGVDRCWFLRNGGDAIHSGSDSDAVVGRTSLVANHGAGVYAAGYRGTVLLTSNLIVSNGIGVSGGYGQDLESRHNDVWSNDDDWYWSYPGPTDISVDPIFLDEVAEDYRIAPYSPLINAGDPEIALDPDSTICDIGAGWVDQSSGLVLTATPQRRVYFPRESARVIHRLTDLADSGWSVELERWIVGPKGGRIPLDALSANVPPGGSLAIEDSLTIRRDAPLGRYLYCVEIEGLTGDQRWVWVE